MLNLSKWKTDTDNSGTVPWALGVAIAGGSVLGFWALMTWGNAAGPGAATNELLTWEAFFRGATLVLAAVVGFSSYFRQGELEKIRQDFQRLEAEKRFQAEISDRARAAINDHIGDINGSFSKIEGNVNRLPEEARRGNQGFVVQFPPSLNTVVTIDGYAQGETEDRRVQARDETEVDE